MFRLQPNRLWIPFNSCLSGSHPTFQTKEKSTTNIKTQIFSNNQMFRLRFDRRVDIFLEATLTNPMDYFDLIRVSKNQLQTTKHRYFLTTKCLGWDLTDVWICFWKPPWRIPWTTLISFKFLKSITHDKHKYFLTVNCFRRVDIFLEATLTNPMDCFNLQHLSQNNIYLKISGQISPGKEFEPHTIH